MTVIRTQYFFNNSNHYYVTNLKRFSGENPFALFRRFP